MIKNTVAQMDTLIAKRDTLTAKIRDVGLKALDNNTFKLGQLASRMAEIRDESKHIQETLDKI